METLRPRILITGIGGAIGAHLVRYVLNCTDWEIVGIDSFRHKGDFDRLNVVVEPEERERVQIITHDLTAPLSARQKARIGCVDFLVNLASISDVSASIADPAPVVRNNIDLVLNLLEFAREYPPQVFLQFSTDEVYGPTPVDSGGHREWDPIKPSNPYSASKAAQEALCFAWWRSYNVPVVITNTMNNFGHMQAPSKFPAMVQSLVAKGEPVQIHAAASGEIGTRYYIHSHNTADAVVYLLTQTVPTMHVPGEIDEPDRWHIVGDRQLNNLALAHEIAGVMGKELKFELVDFHRGQPGHDLHYGLSGKKLAEHGWRSPWGFDPSLQDTVRWTAEHPEWLD